MKIPAEVPSSLRELAAVLSQPKPMRRGSVSERTMKCGKAGCPCQEDPKARHGPYYSLTRPTAGKTHSRYLSPQLPCPCGGSAQYHGRHEKTFESVLGPLHLQRAYYHCEQCESGFCPRDRALGLESFSLTPGVLRMTASAAALLSFEESSGLLHELAGAEVSAKQVERAAEALGAEIAVDEHQQVEKMGEVTPTMYLGMDGTGVPMRTQEVADRAGKQADGSAKTREAKLVTIWTAESRDEEGQLVRPRIDHLFGRD